MTTQNPIADLLSIEPKSGTIVIDGLEFDYIASTHGISEGIYRRNAGHGVSNPCFSLFWTPPTHHRMTLGQYLAGRRGVKRDEAEAIVATASVTRKDTE